MVATVNPNGIHIPDQVTKLEQEGLGMGNSHSPAIE